MQPRAYEAPFVEMITVKAAAGDRELHSEYQKEFECKSRWLQHVKLLK